MPGETRTVAIEHDTGGIPFEERRAVLAGQRGIPGDVHFNPGAASGPLYYRTRARSEPSPTAVTWRTAPG